MWCENDLQSTAPTNTHMHIYVKAHSLSLSHTHTYLHTYTHTHTHTHTNTSLTQSLTQYTCKYIHADKYINSMLVQDLIWLNYLTWLLWTHLPVCYMSSCVLAMSNVYCSTRADTHPHRHTYPHVHTHTHTHTQTHTGCGAVWLSL